MAERDLSRLCQSVLPAEFEQVKRLLPPIQAFLDANLADAVKGSVTLLSVTDEQIVIAASTPMVANYLRLHSVEIRQQLRETFQLEQELKFRTIPDALMHPRKQAKLPRPQAVSAEAVAAIKLNAQWIEDEDLRAAMLSLADCLAADPESQRRG
jgi:hypothetical protein